MVWSREIRKFRCVKASTNRKRPGALERRRAKRAFRAEVADSVGWGTGLQATRQHAGAIEDVFHLGEERDFATEGAAETEECGESHTVFMGVARTGLDGS